MDDYTSDIFVPRLAVIGAGGQGCNLVNRLYRTGIKSATTIAVNTDVKHLDIISAHKKLLLGKQITRGLGAGGFLRHCRFSLKWGFLKHYVSKNCASQ